MHVDQRGKRIRNPTRKNRDEPRYFEGILVAADAYRGLHRLNLRTGAKELLVPPDLPIDGEVNALTNSVAVTKDGKKIYYTTSR